ncbi:phosphotransferase [Peribacillus deserti]|uniref:Aminoglycoside phosphotransferase family protein n=1 Tax=Peribacillus deserti TaxID=673318 RepID=A0A2N5M1C3_9BACI|nr:phosphotransferase [Peribacillus deserti]PLT28150.1 aminoglycoside phosphotransferase family protein [Peribacillus deserti]
MKIMLFISHPSHSKLLVLPTENGFVLPIVDAELLQAEMVGPLQSAVRTQLGYETSIGRQLFKRDNDYPQAIFEARLIDYDAGKGQWSDAKDIQRILLPSEASKHILESWIAEQKDIPRNRAKWFHPNFSTQSREWIFKEMNAANIRTCGKLDQVKASDFCLIERIPTTDGDLFFKAVSKASCHEAALTEYLHRRHPDLTADCVSVDNSSGWLLMRDIGGEPLRGNRNKKIWQRAIQEYSELQASEADTTDDLLAIGVPDRRIPKLKKEIEMYLRSMCDTGLDIKETEKIIELQPIILDMCDQLDFLPASIDHGDLHSGNIRTKNENFVFFDWGDASVTHPFFSTRVFWHALDELIDTEAEWLGIVDEFRPYYLEPWTRFAPMEELEKALRISDQLACVQRALSWYLYLTPSRENQQESYKRPSQWLRLFLEHRDLVGSDK